MRRIVAALLLSLACVAPQAGCRRGHPEQGGTAAGGAAESVDALIPALGAFTEELAAKVESAEDPKAGAAEAQRLLDSRKGEMAARITAVRRGQLARDASARGRWLEAEVDNTQRVRQLRLKYLDASMRDPELKARLERLADDYDALFKEH